MRRLGGRLWEEATYKTRTELGGGRVLLGKSQDISTNDDGDGKENGTHFRHPTDEQLGHLDIFF